VGVSTLGLLISYRFKGMIGRGREAVSKLNVYEMEKSRGMRFLE
jgi:hypothetical protein